MNTFKHSQTFQSRLSERIINGITTLTDQFFELYQQIDEWLEKKQELGFHYRDYINAPAIKKTGWLFLLFVLVPCVGLFDYSSISSFIQYLSASSGGMVGTVIQLVGWVFFLLLELAIGWLIIHSKSKPALRFMSLLLAVIMTLLPSFLIYSTYTLTEDKTPILFSKTIALIAVSIILHALLFLVITEIWNAINYIIYCAKNTILKSKNPQVQLERVRKELQQLHTDFDHYIIREKQANISALLHNRAWYIKGKLQEGLTGNEYDLSDYNPNVQYAPATYSATAEPNAN